MAKDSPDYLEGRYDALHDDVKDLKRWKDSTETWKTKLETQVESVPDRVVDRLKANRSAKDQAPITSTSGENGTTPGANDSGKQSQAGNTSPSGDGQKIDPPPPKANPADQRDPDTTSKEPAPTKARRGFFQRLR